MNLINFRSIGTERRAATQSKLKRKKGFGALAPKFFFAKAEMALSGLLCACAERSGVQDATRPALQLVVGVAVRSEAEHGDTNDMMCAVGLEETLPKDTKRRQVCTRYWLYSPHARIAG